MTEDCCFVDDRFEMSKLVGVEIFGPWKCTDARA
jgi:hypothetical protein